jgi:putative peptidoglycan lipid II flippase
MVISIVSIGVNAVADYFFKRWLSPYGIGHAGLALATSLVAIVNFVTLFLLLRKKIGRVGGRALFSSFLRVALASGLLSVASYFSWYLVSSQLSSNALYSRAALTFIPIIAGMLIFVAACHVLNIKELHMIGRAIRARFGKTEMPDVQ